MATKQASTIREAFVAVALFAWLCIMNARLYDFISGTLNERDVEHNDPKHVYAIDIDMGACIYEAEDLAELSEWSKRHFDLSLQRAVISGNAPIHYPMGVELEVWGKERFIPAKLQNIKVDERSSEILEERISFEARCLQYFKKHHVNIGWVFSVNPDKTVVLNHLHNNYNGNNATNASYSNDQILHFSESCLSIMGIFLDGETYLEKLERTCPSESVMLRYFTHAKIHELDHLCSSLDTITSLKSTIVLDSTLAYRIHRVWFGRCIGCVEQQRNSTKGVLGWNDSVSSWEMYTENHEYNKPLSTQKSNSSLELTKAWLQIMMTNSEMIKLPHLRVSE